MTRPSRRLHIWALPALTVLLVALVAGERRAATAEARAVSMGAEGEGPRIRRVWANAQDYSTPSPDGRSVAYVDWTTGDVAMHDLQTGTSQLLTDKGSWTEDGSWAEVPRFAPDGNRVAYSYGNVLGRGAGFRYELRYVDVGDTEQHTLYALDVEDEWIAPMDWSATQGILVEVNRENARNSELGIVSPEDGSYRVILKNRPGEPHYHDGAFSPDGRWVVYQWDHDPRVVPTSGGEPQSLGFAVTWVLGWARDGGGVLVHGSHDGSTGVFEIPVANGRRSGAPRLVKGGLPAVIPGGFAGDAYYYGIAVDAPKIHLATVDLAAGRMLSPPAAITTPIEGAAANPAWSSDGRSLAYTLGTIPGSTQRFMVRSVDGDEVREIATFENERVTYLAWAPDGRSLVFLSPGDVGPSLWRLDLGTGEFMEEQKTIGQSAVLTPDGETLVIGRHAPQFPDLPQGVLARDLRTGRERVIARTAAAVNTLSLSPDGRTIAFVEVDPETDRTTLRTVPLSGGATRELMSAENPRHVENNQFSLPWTPDGRGILAIQGGWEHQHDLYVVPLDGGEPVRLLQDLPHSREQPALSPDGRRIAWVAGEQRLEMWVLEDDGRVVGDGAR